MTEIRPERTGSPWQSTEMFDALQRHARAYESTGILETYLETDPENRDKVGRLVAREQGYRSFTRYVLHELGTGSPASTRPPSEVMDRQGIVANVTDDGEVIVEAPYTEEQARLVIDKARQITKILQPYTRQ